MATETEASKQQRGADFSRAKRMATLSKALYDSGISKTALAHQCGIKRVTLTKKFDWAEAVSTFQEPKYREVFTAEDEQLVMESLGKITALLDKLVQGMKKALPSTQV